MYLAAVHRSQVSLSFHPAISADRCTHVPPNINILALEVLCTMRASFLGLDPKQHALAWVFTPFFWFLDYRYASLNALPGCTTVLGHALRRGLAMVACKAFLTGLPVLLLSRDSKAHPCIAASGCLVLLGVQAAVSSSSKGEFALLLQRAGLQCRAEAGPWGR